MNGRPAKPLSGQQLQAAVAEAAAGSRDEVAVVAGVSQSTIKTWRQDPTYQAEVDRLKRESSDALALPLQRLRQHLVTGARRAVDALVENLDATTDRGSAAYDVRQGAAKLLLEHGAAELRKDDARRVGRQTPSSGVVAIQVNLNDDHAAPTSPSERRAGFRRD